MSYIQLVTEPTGMKSKCEEALLESFKGVRSYGDQATESCWWESLSHGPLLLITSMYLKYFLNLRFSCFLDHFLLLTISYDVVQTLINRIRCGQQINMGFCFIQTKLNADLHLFYCLLSILAQCTSSSWLVEKGRTPLT